MIDELNNGTVRRPLNGSMNGTVSRPLMLEERDSESPDEWLDERDSESPELKAWFVAVSCRTKEGKKQC